MDSIFDELCNEFEEALLDGQDPDIESFTARCPSHLVFELIQEFRLVRRELQQKQSKDADATLPEIPGYRVIARLGTGGMGIVYSAIRTRDNRHCAVKMLLAGLDASFEQLARFRIEAEAYACLDHPSIVKIRDVGVVAGCPFLAVDYAENGCLRQYIKTLPSVDTGWCVRLFARLARALSHAHGRSILHRDLKPANILIDKDGVPKVTDFGLVKFAAPMSSVSEENCTMTVSAFLEHELRMSVGEHGQFLPSDGARDRLRSLAVGCARSCKLPDDAIDIDEVQTFIEESIDTREQSEALLPQLEAVTRIGTVMGSPQFMAPEQAMGQLERIGPHTDVYGLGATMYSVIIGQPPICGLEIFTVLRNVCEQIPELPHQRNPAIPKTVGLAIMKAINKNPAQRYQSMDEFADALDRL